MAGSTTYQYILSLQDKMSGALKKAGYLGSQTYDKLQAKQERLNATALGFNSMLGKIGIAFGAFEFGKKILTAGADIEATRIEFQTLLQDINKGNAMVKQLQDFANVTPFETTDLQDAAKMLLNFGVAEKKIMPSLKMLGDVSGGNSEKLRGLTLAFSQMSSTGRLMGQDLLQMVNAGFNPLQEISRTTGISLGELRKQMEKGEISTSMVEAAFRTATVQGGRFYGMMDKMGLSIKGRWSTLMDKLSLSFMKWGELSNASTAKLINKLIVAADWLFRNAEAVMKWGKALLWIVGTWKAVNLIITIAGVVTTWYNSRVRSLNASLYVMNKRLFGAAGASGVYSGITGVAILATNMFTLSIKALGRAIYAIPIIGWIAAGIALLIAAVKILWEKSEKFRGILYGLGNVFKVVWQYAKLFGQFVIGAFKIVWDFVKPIFMGIYNFYKAIITGAIKVYSAIFGGIWSAIKWVWGAIKTVIGGIFNFFKKVFGAVWNGIKWVVGMIGKVITPLKQFVTWIDANIIQPIADAFSWLGNYFGKVWDAIIGGIKGLFKPFVDLWNKIFGKKSLSVDIQANYKKGYEKGVQNFRAEKAGKGVKEPALDVSGMAGMPDIGGSGDIGGGSGISDTSKGIADGGSRPTIINITLSNLVEQITINSQNFKESVTDMQSQIQEGLLRVLNSANGVAYGN